MLFVLLHNIHPSLFPRTSWTTSDGSEDILLKTTFIIDSLYAFSVARSSGVFPQLPLLVDCTTCIRTPTPTPDGATSEAYTCRL